MCCVFIGNKYELVFVKNIKFFQKGQQRLAMIFSMTLDELGRMERSIIIHVVTLASFDDCNDFCYFKF